MATATKKSAKKSAAKTSRSKQIMSRPEPALLELFEDELKDIYWAEKHLTKVLPKMRKGATSAKLAAALNKHLDVTKKQIVRLEQVFMLLGKKAQAKKCEAMAGLSKEGDSILEDTAAGSATRDVGIILACQKVEHYEIATYGVLRQLSITLGLKKIEQLLTQTLNEEKQADLTLTMIAENNINYNAATEEAE